MSKTTFTARPSVLAAALRSVLYAASKSEARLYMRGVALLPEGAVVATDGHRLATVPDVLFSRQNMHWALIVAAADAKELARLLEKCPGERVEFDATGLKLSALIGGAGWSCALLDSEFPDVERILSQQSGPAHFLRARSLVEAAAAAVREISSYNAAEIAEGTALAGDAAGAVRKAVMAGRGGRKGVGFEAGGGSIRLTALTAFLAATDGGAEIAPTHFNARYLLDTARALGDRAQISMAGAGAPAFFRDGRATHVLMPCKA